MRKTVSKILLAIGITLLIAGLITLFLINSLPAVYMLIASVLLNAAGILTLPKKHGEDK